MELGSTSTYKKVNSGCMSVINSHLDYMLKSGIDVCEQHERLPSFYWLPKLHKTPYGTRFIAASNRCTTKQLSALLTSCFKTIITHFKQYCNGIYKHTGVNNSKGVLIKILELPHLTVMILQLCILIYRMMH